MSASAVALLPPTSATACMPALGFIQPLMRALDDETYCKPHVKSNLERAFCLNLAKTPTRCAAAAAAGTSHPLQK
jgi:hypothetical protein